MTKILLYLLAFVALAVLSTGGWIVGRNVNYALSYRSMVQDTIREMVRPEALK